MHNAPTCLADLKPAPCNPRTITPEALSGLKHSLSTFGDISGIVWNRRTGNLVAGHQRLRALREEHGDALRLEGGAVLAPTGERFPVRVVDWDDATERAANVAANSPAISGDFTARLQEVLDDIAQESSELYDDLSMQRLDVPPDTAAFHPIDPRGADDVQPVADMAAEVRLPASGLTDLEEVCASRGWEIAKTRQCRASSAL